MHNHEPRDYHCPFCAVIDGKESDLNKRSDIFYEDDVLIAYIAPKWWVNNPGNALIIPKKHVENIYDIEDDLLSAISIFSKRVALAMKKSYGCDGISFRQHNEPSGNQDVWHFHHHVFPRWEGDDLYVNHMKKKYVTTEEKISYADKLRRELNKDKI